MSTVYRLKISKDYLKFSCAHMTVFDATTKEKLHGHNYRVHTTLEYRQAASIEFIDLRQVKAVLSQLCTAWDEHTLVAEQTPHFEHAPCEEPNSRAFRLCNKYYAMPAEDVIFLPLANITVEALAQYFGSLFCAQASSEPWYSSLVTASFAIEETNGQSAEVSVKINPTV